MGQLKHQLEIHRRVDDASQREVQDQAVRVLMLLATVPKFADWKGLVSESAQADVEKLLVGFTPIGGQQEGNVPQSGTVYIATEKITYHAQTATMT